MDGPDLRPVKISELQNIGPVSAGWLNEIGLYTLSDLEEIGAVEAYRQIKARGHKATLNIVYGIQGAIINCPWNHLPPYMRDRLKAEVEVIKKSQDG